MCDGMRFAKNVNQTEDTNTYVRNVGIFHFYTLFLFATAPIALSRSLFASETAWRRKK